MTEFVQAIVTLITELFKALIMLLGDLGTLVFTVNTETGVVSGVTPFGWLVAIMVGIPLATWLFNKAFTFVKGLGAKGK